MKNKQSIRVIATTFAMLSLAFIFACQKQAVVEYKKFQTAEDVPRISPQEAKKEVDAGNAIMIDSRVETAFNDEHITGAINIPIGSPPEKFDSLPKDKKLIIYCS